MMAAESVASAAGRPADPVLLRRRAACYVALEDRGEGAGMEKEKLATLAPGRLSRILAEGLRGHHLLFDHGAILEAFASPDAPVAGEDANAVGHALLTICKEPLGVARAAIQALPESARVSLIRLYFRLLDRANEEQPLRH
jgi:hypothetical protein